MARTGFLLALLPLALATSSRAGLQIDSFSVKAEAFAHYFSDDNGVTDPHESFDQSTLPYTLMARVVREGDARTDPPGFVPTNVLASAVQDKGGFYAGLSTVKQPSFLTVGGHANTYTEYFIGVTTDTPDTPLRLDIIFLGSILDAQAQYGFGAMGSHYAATIRANFSNRSLGEVWGFRDELKLNNLYSYTFTGGPIGDVDTFGIGLPTSTFASGYSGFDAFGTQSRTSFNGTIDFGLLQPGETFFFGYGAQTRVHCDFQYTGSCTASLVDPFGLQNPPPFQVHLQGLPLPAAPVPEPATTLLWVTGLVGTCVAAGRRRAAAR